MAVVTEMVALVAVFGVVVLLARFLRNYLHVRKLELAIPGPPSLFLLGNALEFVFVTPDSVMQTLLRMIGGRREMSRFSILNNLILTVQDPEQIDEVLRCKKFDDKPSFFYSLLHIVAHKGLIQINGAEWKAHRKWLEPGFNINVLNRFVDVFSEEAKGFADRVEADQDVDVADSLRKANVRIFFRTSMSTADSSEYEGKAMDALEFGEIFVRSVNNRSFNPVLWPDRVFSLTPLGRTVHKSKKVIDDHCNDFIAKKRAEIGEHKNDLDLKRTRKTLIDTMLDPPSGLEELSENAIIDEFITFFGANVETTVSALSWTFKVLSLLPEVQQQVHTELDSLFGDSDRGVSVEDLPKLQYVTRVVKEVMRMFPTVPFVARQCHEETTLCGHTIPGGTTVAINIYGAHRDPEHWDKPEEFDPDRFLPERCKDRHPCAYMPFSMGPRKCIGGKYAMMNLTAFLATTLRALEVLPVDDHKNLQSLTNNMTFDMSSHLVGGTRVKFHRRGTSAA